MTKKELEDLKAKVAAEKALRAKEDQADKAEEEKLLAEARSLGIKVDSAKKSDSNTEKNEEDKKETLKKDDGSLMKKEETFKKEETTKSEDAAADLEKIIKNATISAVNAVKELDKEETKKEEETTNLYG